MNRITELIENYIHPITGWEYKKSIEQHTMQIKIKRQQTKKNK